MGCAGMTGSLTIRGVQDDIALPLYPKAGPITRGRSRGSQSPVIRLCEVIHTFQIDLACPASASLVLVPPSDSEGATP